MIISGGSRSNWRFFSKHLMKTEENERVEITEIRGLAAEDVKEAFREMDALASGTRCKNFFYHADINPRADEVLTPEQWEKAVDTLEANLGLEGHSRFIVEHEKCGRTHRHVVWSRIDTDSMTAVSDSQNYAKHERTARQLEKEFGHEAVQGAHDREPGTPRPDRAHENWETFRGADSGIDPKDVKAEVTELWNRSDNGHAFAAALEESGYVLCKGDKRDFCIIDPAGDAHSLARRIAGVKAADIRARMADIDRDALPSVAEASAAVRSRGGENEVAQEIAEEITPADTTTTGNREAGTTAFDSFAKDVKQVMEDNNGDLRPLPNAVDEAGTTSFSESSSLFERFVNSVREVMRSENGHMPVRDGLTWWERVAITAAIPVIAEIIHHVVEQVTEKVTGYWQKLVDRSRQSHDKEHDFDHGFER